MNLILNNIALGERFFFKHKNIQSTIEHDYYFFRISKKNKLLIKYTYKGLRQRVLLLQIKSQPMIFFFPSKHEFVLI